jgi:hypothetical protein
MDLSPEMLLFEIAAICSRHGVPVQTANPSASVHYAEQLMRSLGITPGEPAAIAAAPAAAPVELPPLPVNGFTRGVAAVRRTPPRHGSLRPVND